MANQFPIESSGDPESLRLDEDTRRLKNWKRWGPYLSERQWGTVREDYSPDGSCWDYFTHDQARSRAYRWGEDGLLGVSDREGRLCFALALWNGRDPILKERLYGLTGPEGNHGEDVKECYYYLDSTPTHSYMKALYKYPQREYPYARLLDENRRRGKEAPELELVDTGVFEGGRYFDVFAEYAKGSPDDLLIKITIANRGPEPAPIDLLPTLWFRNTWSWGRSGEGYWPKPSIRLDGSARKGEVAVVTGHATLGRCRMAAEARPGGAPEVLFTDNETNVARLFGSANPGPYVKDAFHEYLINGRREAVNPQGVGTKIAFHYRLEVPAGGEVTVKLRLGASGGSGAAAASGKTASPASSAASFGPEFDRIFADRAREGDRFYETKRPGVKREEWRAARQAIAGLLWSKQFYHYIVKDWLEGDPSQPPPPPERREGRNADWQHLFNRDILSMPDAWEYPWFAAWDLAFHTLPLSAIDPQFAKEQLVLMLREWYMHPNGQIPAYEFAFGDVNPPVHAWACWRVYKISGARGQRDRVFLSRVFQKLVINFTWWVNRKDVTGKHIFSGGFLGLDNIGVFDRSQPLPTGGYLEQADGTAWMAFYANTMLSIALELSKENPATEDMASKFFEHFIAIADAMNTLGGTGLWDETDGFYYDQLHMDGTNSPLRVRSLVGAIPLLAVEVLESEVCDRLPGFVKRLNWFLENRRDLARHTSYMETGEGTMRGHRLLAIPSRERLVRVLRYLLDENEFLSPYGLRSVSKFHKDHPYLFYADGKEFKVSYAPGESDTGLFGGNSNWRGPIWFPLNYLLVEALERYHHFYGDSLRVEFPTGSGTMMNLAEVSHELSGRLARIFLPDAEGRRPCHGDDPRYANDPAWRDLVLFHEYFHGETGRGLGASHQTGWTALAARLLVERGRSHEAIHGATGR
ncbi:MAG TPA: glucosidase [Candidatus Polarisedimenticolia bacterium]